MSEQDNDLVDRHPRGITYALLGNLHARLSLKPPSIVLDPKRKKTKMHGKASWVLGNHANCNGILCEVSCRTIQYVETMENWYSN